MVKMSRMSNIPITHTLLIRCPCGMVYSFRAQHVNAAGLAYSWRDDSRDLCPQCRRPASHVWKVARPEWME